MKAFHRRKRGYFSEEETNSRGNLALNEHNREEND